MIPYWVRHFMEESKKPYKIIQSPQAENSLVPQKLIERLKKEQEDERDRFARYFHGKFDLAWSYGNCAICNGPLKVEGGRHTATIIIHPCPKCFPPKEIP